ncbi:MAG: nitrilase-related carbon-nitrogen hydrolase [Solirubrobacteraceae bacterium]
MKLAVAQIEAVPLDLEANLRLTSEAVQAAAGRGADLVVLPELVASGYVLDDPAIRDLAEPGDGSGRALGSWSALAQRLGVAIIGGYPELAGARLFNSVAVIDRTGTLRGGYRKLHLFRGEKQRFEPGDLGLPVFELDGVRVGVIVCYDLRFPETIRLLAIESGAELIAVPTAWVVGFDPSATPADARISQVEGAIVQANLNQVFVACADLCGSGTGATFLGRSLIASPYGESLVGPLSAADPAVAVAEIDLSEVRGAQDRGGGISPRADRRTDVYTLIRAEESSANRGEPRDSGAGSEPALGPRVAALVQLGALIAQGAEEAELGLGMRAALELGASKRDLRGVLEQVPGGPSPGRAAALRAFERVAKARAEPRS